MTRYRDDKGNRDHPGPDSEGPYERDRNDRYDADRTGYARGGRHDEADYGESTVVRKQPGGGPVMGGPYPNNREFRRGFVERPRYEPDESRYGGGTERARQRDYDAHEDEGRSLWEEGRDYLRGRSSHSEGHRPSRSHIRCRDIMTRDVTVAARSTTLREVAKMMKEEDTGVIPVVDDHDASANAAETTEGRRVNTRMHGNGHLAGLITDRDMVIRAIADGKDINTTRVEEVMTTDIHTAQPNDRVIDVVRKMGDKQVRRIPVIDSSGNLRGIISMADVALETEQDRELAEALEEISQGSSFWSKVVG